MKKLISVAVAAMFAAASFNAAAQAKKEELKVKKEGAAVTTKDGKAVTTKGVKETPKMEPKPKAAAPAPAPKEKIKGQAVTTKDGKAVATKDQKGVNTKDK